MSILNLFKKRPKFKSGALPDVRPEREKKKDYEHKEVAKAPTLIWKEKPQSEWADYPTFDQDGSGSCVAQAITKALGIENIREEGKFVDLSARDLYARRDNNGPGMYTFKALEDIREDGVTVEQQMPSQGLDERAMNKDNDRTVSDVIIGRIFKATNWIKIKPEIDKIAEALEDNHPVIMTVRFKRGEWNRKMPNIRNLNKSWCYHKITAIDYFLWNGEKVILIDDSWGADTGYDGRRLVTKEWFANRINHCYYFKPLMNDRETEKERPDYEFNKDLEYHDNNDSVAKLQEILKLEGFFPFNIPETSWYGGITRKAVKEFQYHYEVAPEAELEAVDGFRVGPDTRAKLNEICKN